MFRMVSKEPVNNQLSKRTKLKAGTYRSVRLSFLLGKDGITAPSAC